MNITETDSLYQGLMGIKCLIQAGKLYEVEVCLDKLLERFGKIEELQMFYNGDTHMNTKEGLHQ